MVGQRSSGGVLLRALLAIAVLALVAVGVASFWTGPPVHVAIHPGLPGIGRRTPVSVKLDDTGRVEKVTVELLQGMDVRPVAEKSFASHPAWQLWRRPVPADLQFDVGRETVPGLRGGEATLRVTAERSGTWFRRPDPTIVELKLPVRLAPPSLGVLSGFHYVAQGGCEAVVYRVGPGAVQDGVQSGAWWFPGYPLPGAQPAAAATPAAGTPGAPGGVGNAGAVHFALFAVPYDATDASQVRLTAVDDVGNRAQAAFVDKFFPKPLKYDTIQVNDAFLQRVVPEILRETPGLQDRGGLLENYLEINGDLRRREATELAALAGRSAPRFLWNEPFMPMPNAKITAAFAQRRDYRYNGRHVDQQDHLGFDMASVEHAPVPASNRGTVLLARFFGIYGNAVVVDHGYGLMSLYGHLSSLAVHEGDTVARGQELGRSGQTGLAGGDHLHFTLLVGGRMVTPVEWWDPHWMTDRVERKLKEAK